MIDRTGLTPEQNDMIDAILNLPANGLEQAVDEGLVSAEEASLVIELIMLERTDEQVVTQDDCVVSNAVLQLLQARAKRQSRRSGNWRCR